MSGHSKWANIKVRKGSQDKKRGETFSRVAKTIITAIREGGGNTNPDSNVHLREAIDKAKEVNMPKENIERLLRTFEERKVNMVDMVLEGYGPAGVPLIVEIQTDSKNRTLGEIRSLFHRHGGDLGVGGSVAFLFEKKGEVELLDLPEEQQLTVIDWGVEEIEKTTLVVAVEQVAEIRGKAEAAGFKVLRSEVAMRPISPMTVDSVQLEGVVELIDELEENDDVVSVWAGIRG